MIPDQTVPTLPPLRRGRVVAAGVVVVVAVVVALVVVLNTGGDDPTPARAGAVYSAPFGQLSGNDPSVELPAGTLSAEVSAPATTLPKNVSDGRKVGPPAGGRFVRVAWQGRKDVTVPPEVFTSDAPALAPGITLVAGGHRYPLPVDDLEAVSHDGSQRDLPAGAAWVAVAGSARQLRLDVSYDGVTQQLDVATGTRVTGRAAALYGKPGPERSCGTATVPTGYSARLTEVSDCHVTTFRTAYVDGLGWSPAGRSWLVVVAGGNAVVSVDHRVGGRSVRLFLQGETQQTVQLGRTAMTPAAEFGPPLSDPGDRSGQQQAWVTSVPASAGSVVPLTITETGVYSQIGDFEPGQLVPGTSVAVRYTVPSG